ncbi:MAG TPA: type II toxin-antitoxin system prevent-host-death family antitoxin [Stellaceae bacterium]|nr:type II toxin-antitoxin system prevent-host-death family antitoxin [Stellaceae bacterium]
MALDETVSAAEANRSFSRLLRGVREGRSYTVTAHGRPVARIVPASERDDVERRVRAAALKVLLDRIRNQPVINVGPWTRDELYER